METSVVVEPQQKDSLSVGRVVKSAREGKNLSVDEVARATRIRKEFLVAIEEERFEALPGDVFARGFVKSYADFLGLDGKQIALRASEHLRPGTLPPPAGVTAKHGGGAARVLFLTLVMGVAAAVWYIQKHHLIH